MTWQLEGRWIPNGRLDFKIDFIYARSNLTVDFGSDGADQIGRLGEGSSNLSHPRPNGRPPEAEGRRGCRPRQRRRRHGWNWPRAAGARRGGLTWTRTGPGERGALRGPLEEVVVDGFLPESVGDGGGRRAEVSSRRWSLAVARRSCFGRGTKKEVEDELQVWSSGTEARRRGRTAAAIEAARFGEKGKFFAAGQV